MKEGYDFEEAKIIALNLEKTEIDLFNMSGESNATFVPQLTPDVPREKILNSSEAVRSRLTRTAGIPLAEKDVTKLFLSKEPQWQRAMFCMA